MVEKVQRKGGKKRGKGKERGTRWSKDTCTHRKYEKLAPIFRTELNIMFNICGASDSDNLADYNVRVVNVNIELN